MTIQTLGTFQLLSHPAVTWTFNPQTCNHRVTCGHETENKLSVQAAQRAFGRFVAQAKDAGIAQTKADLQAVHKAEDERDQWCVKNGQYTNSPEIDALEHALYLAEQKRFASRFAVEEVMGYEWLRTHSV